MAIENSAMRDMDGGATQYMKDGAMRLMERGTAKVKGAPERW